MPATTSAMLSRSLYAAITIATGEISTGPWEARSSSTATRSIKLVDLPPAAPGAGVHTERPAEAAASMSVAVTWRSVAVRGEPSEAGAES